jgi:hypothetical protein
MPAPDTVRTDFSSDCGSDTWEYGDAKYEKAKGRRLEDKIADKVAQKNTSATAVFRMFDKDHSGALSRPELLMGLNELGFYPNTKEWKHILNKVDPNKDGRISFGEFHEALTVQDYDKAHDNRILGDRDNKGPRAKKDNLGVNMFANSDAWEGVKMQKKKGVFSPIPGNTLEGGLAEKVDVSSLPGYFKNLKKAKKLIECAATVDHLNEKEVYGSKPGDAPQLQQTMMLNTAREVVPVNSRKTLLAQRSRDRLAAASNCVPDIPNLTHHGAYRSSQFLPTGDLRFPSKGLDLVHMNKILLDARMVELNKTSDNLLNAMKGRGCA